MNREHRRSMSTRGGTVHGGRKYVVLVLVLAGLLLTLAGCSGSGGSDTSAGASSGGTTTYTNDKYGFTLTHDTQLTEGEPVAGAGAGGSSVFDVVFADTNGTTISDRYVDAIQISVYELAREVKPAEVPKLKAELQGVVDQLMTSTTAATVVEPLSPVTVNGVPGFAFKYTYTEGGTELTAITFFLFKGKYEYEITAQTTSANWEALSAKLEAAVQTFTAN
jgi:hypothetical protein